MAIAEGVKGAIGKPPVAPAGAKPPATKETKQHGSDRAEGFQRAIGKPFGRVRRRETLCDKQNQAANYPKSGAALPKRSAISFMGMIRFRRGLSRAG